MSKKIKIDMSKMRNLGKKQILAPYLEKYIRTNGNDPWSFSFENTHTGGTDTAWHPSSDCMAPPSELLAKARGEKVEKFNEDGGLNKHMMVGHFWHQWLQHICLKLEFCSEPNIERVGERAWATEKTDRWVPGKPDVQMMSYRTIAKPYCWATGSADIAPIVLPKGWEGVVDFKTMSSTSFKKDDVPFGDKYECQINIYMDFFDLDKALMLGINKDAPHAFKEFQYNRNQPLIDAIYDKWKYVGERLDEDRPEVGERADENFQLDKLLENFQLDKLLLGPAG